MARGITMPSLDQPPKVILDNLDLLLDWEVLQVAKDWPLLKVMHLVKRIPEPKTENKKPVQPSEELEP
jgi:hypothetical protein